MTEESKRGKPFVQWFFKLRLRNGIEKCYYISEEDRERLWKLFSNTTRMKGFFEFHSDTHRVVIQASQLQFCQFYFDYFLISPFSRISSPDEKDDASYEIEIYFVNDPNPMVFEVDNEPNPNEEGDEGEVSNFLEYLLMSHEEEFLNFTDLSEETTFIQVSNIALVEAPLHLFDFDEVFEDDSEKESGAGIET